MNRLVLAISVIISSFYNVYAAYKGDVIVLMPSSNVSSSTLHELKLRFPKYDFSLCCSTDPLTFYSQKAKAIKTNCLQKALQQKDSVIWCLRGGYGVARLLGMLPKKINNNKIIIGYSDVTALLNYTAELYGWKNIHGAMLKERLETQRNQNLLQVDKYLNDRIVPKITDIQPMNNHAREITCINGKLAGGNLSIVQSSIGTFWQINSKGRILMLEDVGEAPYVLDRNLVHLWQSNIFKGCKAIIFGDFSMCKGAKKEVDAVLQEFAKNIDIPVFKTDKFGHGNINIPFIFNRVYSLKKQKTRFVLG